MFRRWEAGTLVGHAYENRSNYLATRETDGYDAQLVACGQELGGNGGRRSHCCFEKSLECRMIPVMQPF